MRTKLLSISKKRKSSLIHSLRQMRKRRRLKSKRQRQKILNKRSNLLHRKLQLFRLIQTLKNSQCLKNRYRNKSKQYMKNQKKKSQQKHKQKIRKILNKNQMHSLKISSSSFLSKKQPQPLKFQINKNEIQTGIMISTC